MSEDRIEYDAGAVDAARLKRLEAEVSPSALEWAEAEKLGAGSVLGAPRDGKVQAETAVEAELDVDLMDFSSALVMIRGGHRMARRGWNGKGMFLFLVNGSRFAVNRAPLLGIYPEGTVIDYRPHIDMRTADGQIVPWVASQSDLLEDDWCLAD